MAVGGVADDLGSAVRELDAVLALGSVSVVSLLVREVVPGLPVLHSVRERIIFRYRDL